MSSNDMLALAERLAGSLGPFNFVSREERDMVVSALRSASAVGRSGASREEIARIAQEKMVEHLWIESQEYEIVGRGKASYAIADAILSLHPVGKESVQTRFAESGNCGTRESLTKSGSSFAGQGNNPPHVLVIGTVTLRRLANGEAVWIDAAQAGAVAADDFPREAILALTTPDGGVAS